MSQVMRTVKIPECMNPFYVEVNGHKYSYPAGTTQEVPEEVAAVIEAHEGVHHHGYNGPVHNQSLNIRADWNVSDPGDLRFVRNRPCYEETEVLFDQTIEIGSTEGEPVYMMLQALPISVGDFLKVTFDGVAYEMEAFGFNGYAGFGNSAIFGGEDNGIPFCGATMGTEEAGETVILGAPGVHSVKIEGIVVHPLDPKFIPDGIGGGVVIVKEADTQTYASAATYANMNAAEIAEAVFAGKSVYFLEGTTLFPFIFGYRFDELASGVMTATSMPDPYAMFGAIDDDGEFEYRKISPEGTISGSSTELKEKQVITTRIYQSGESYGTTFMFSELQQAAQAGKHVVAVFGTEYYPLWHLATGNSIVFGRYDGTKMEKITISSSSSVSFSTE